MYTIATNAQVTSGNSVFYVKTGGTYAASDLVPCSATPGGLAVVQFLAVFVATGSNEA